jgi:hypothetical protein
MSISFLRHTLARPPPSQVMCEPDIFARADRSLVEVGDGDDRARMGGEMTDDQPAIQRHGNDVQRRRQPARDVLRAVIGDATFVGARKHADRDERDRLARRLRCRDRQLDRATRSR